MQICAWECKIPQIRTWYGGTVPVGLAWPSAQCFFFWWVRVSLHGADPPSSHPSCSYAKVPPIHKICRTAHTFILHMHHECYAKLKHLSRKRPICAPFFFKPYPFPNMLQESMFSLSMAHARKDVAACGWMSMQAIIW